MSKNLVIVESPAKAKKINQFLGKDYSVMASVGHVRDLPAKKLGVDVEKEFEPEYVSTARGKKVLKELKDEAKKCEKVYLAPDPDREGEAIAWHLYEALKKTVGEENFYRVTYNEITKPAILAAFEQPEQIDMDRVNAQQARRILDRLVGFQGSPVVRKQIRGAQSVGRVQTVALRLVVERENEIENFKPETYFTVGAQVRKQEQPLDPFSVKLARINNEPIGVKDRKLLPGAVKTQEQLEAIQKELDSSAMKVSDVITKEVTRRARPPFITSTLQQSASGSLGFAPARTMGIAQKLYESGLITYMRTDSFNIAKSAQEEGREFIKSNYGAEYLPEKPNFYKSKGAAQEAHEAIRPTDVTVEPGREGIKLEAAEQKLYRLIWERFVASQMVPAKINRRTIEVEAGSENTYLFRATASEIAFPGYMKASGIEAAADKPKEGEDNAETEKIPPLTKGEGLDVLDWLTEQKETKPVARYTEASLIRALEENGVGRPSTYAAIMSKLDEREYVIKEKRSLIPTDLGKELVTLVLRTEAKLKHENKIDLFEARFTADMETKLDEVEEGKIEWTEMMKEFYPSLLEWIEHAKETAEPAFVEKCFQALENVTEWAPAVKSGRRTYDDNKTFLDLKEKVAEGELLSKRQGEMLHKMCCRYMKQVPETLVKELELVEPEAVRGDTPRKLELLAKVKFDEPQKVGKRTYDDKKFVTSLGDQITMGKRLSERQVAYLDTLLTKYSDQIENFEAVKAEFKLGEKVEVEADPSTAPVLAMMEQVTEWAEPTKRGKREFNDKTFYESLSSQFKGKGSLSDRQLAALKKMAARYADQIPNYAEMQDQYGLPAPRKPKPKKEEAATEE
ncbi:type I DNA topoisomerase [Pontiella agarivorans]|uniref:DNA topoisomerase 1 n=1 Tax=Pontiella agarivorans TaxID=3038953 RepID=A0ABU5MY15_9BACT|nr:type I DNA topoisomerase [Pontiella agarivorans]MDZ8119053.1 type I DNA topoisomerase [Pontiella agarivorans]